MSTSLTSIVSPPAEETRQEKRRRFINAYWLRPENAFWMVLRSDALAHVPLKTPVADLSCGDGVFSFLHAGGKFDPSFDVFGATTPVPAGDPDHRDMFDYIDDDYRPVIAREPVFRVDCGTDCKASMLEKASKLSLYDRLILHDNNERLPFGDGEFGTVYCNAAYWVDRIDDFLRELRRVVMDDGSVVLQVKLDVMRKFTMNQHRDVFGDRWLDIIDRGRMNCWPSLSDRATWERRFHNAGFDIAHSEAFVTGTHAQVWDVGMRPIAPLLVKAMNAIHPHLRQEIKRDWVDLFCDLLEPFCNSNLQMFTEGSEPVEIQYVLTRR